jgi:hypothetical protein
MKTETWQDKARNIAERVWHFQNGLYFKHQQQFRRMRRWLGKVWGIFWVLFLGIAVVLTAIDEALKLIALPAEQRGPLAFLVPPVQWLLSWFPFDTFSAWLVRGAEGLSSPWVGWLFMMVMAAGILAVVVFLLWQIPRIIVTHQEVKEELRREVLEKTLQPVPSRSEIAWRFGTVLVVVWLGLRLFEHVARWLGYCVLDTSDSCEHTSLNNEIWLTFAVGLGAMSIWQMYEARVARNTARRELATLEKPVFRRIGDALKLFICTFFIIFVLSGLVAIAVALLLDV